MPPQQVCYGLIREPRAPIASWDHQNMEVNILSPLTTFHLDFRKEFVYRKSIMFIHWFPVCIWERIIAPFSFEIKRQVLGQKKAQGARCEKASAIQQLWWRLVNHTIEAFLKFWNLETTSYLQIFLVILRTGFALIYSKVVVQIFFLCSPLFGEDSQFD